MGEVGAEGTVRSYRDLRVWQGAVELSVLVYELTKDFPSEERYGLSSQMRRSEVSVASNIAEGHARQHRSEYLQFLSIARGSLAELDTQLEIALRLEVLKPESSGPLAEKTTTLSRQLNALIATLRRNP